jgi:nucleoside 2-deoxyribosyltransferase
MRIYVGHSKKSEYRSELYEPLRNSRLNEEHEIVLPHEKSDAPFNSKEFLQTCDLMIAEVSYPATGLGIELGWADALGIPIMCVYKKGAKVSGSLNGMTKDFVEYSSGDELVDGIERVIERHIFSRRV